MDPWDREEDAIIRDYNDGILTEREMRRELSDLRAAFAEMVEQEADAAAQEVYENYGWLGR